MPVKKSPSEEQRRSAAFNSSRDDAFVKLYKLHGGPVELGRDMARGVFREPCRRFKFDRVLDKVFKDGLSDKPTADDVSLLRHWPHVALVADLYASDHRLHAQRPSLKPSEIEKIIHRISADSRKLFQNLRKLSSLAVQPTSSAAKMREPHIFWLDDLISQNILGPARDTPDQDLYVQYHALVTRRAFEETLEQVRYGAERAIENLNTDLLESGRRQTDGGLYNLTWRAAEIWKSLTGETPSVSKVQSKNEDAMGDRPRFVRFVCRIADMAIPGQYPSTDMVATSYNRYRDENKSR